MVNIFLCFGDNVAHKIAPLEGDILFVLKLYAKLATNLMKKAAKSC